MAKLKEIEEYRKRPLKLTKEETPPTLPTPTEVAEKGYSRAPRTIIGLLGGGLIGGFIAGPFGALAGGLLLGGLGALADQEEQK